MLELFSFSIVLTRFWKKLKFSWRGEGKLGSGEGGKSRFRKGQLHPCPIANYTLE
jgi:hypothetical protein